MAKLSSKHRNSLSKSEFGMPGSRKYPMPDRSHAANAKARATQMVEKGKLSPSSAAKIRAKANKILGESNMKHKKEAHHSKHHESSHHAKKHHAAMRKHHKSLAKIHAAAEKHHEHMMNKAKKK